MFVCCVTRYTATFGLFAVNWTSSLASPSSLCIMLCFFSRFFLLLWSVSSLQLRPPRHINHRTVSSHLHQSKPIITSKSPINYKSERLRSYFEDLELFVLVGASDDRSKMGNKILRCMLTHQKSCIVLSKSLPEVEGAPTVPGLAAMVEQLPSRYPSLSLDKVGMNMTVVFLTYVPTYHLPSVI